MKPRMSYDYTLQKNVRGKPYITVSPRGISNGLSDIPNDGADFGPDTPGTQTSGIQEAINYAVSFIQSSVPSVSVFPFPEIFLLQGNFIINDNATIWINNNPNSSSPYKPTGLHISGVSESQHTCAIVKQNSLPSPIISFTNPYGSSTGFAPTGMTFENFAIWYTGPASNATPGVTMANLSIPEVGGSMTVFRNFQVISLNPINNTLLDISGHDDGLADNLFVSSGSGGYNSLTIPPLKVYTPGGMFVINRTMASGIDVSTQQTNIINSTIGTGGGPGIIFRPSIPGSILNLQGVYFNGDYMIEPNANIPIEWDFSEAVFINTNTSYSLYLFDPSITTNDEYLNLYTHAMNNSKNVILKTENSTSGTTAGTVSMKFITYLSNYKKLIIYISGYENNTTTNQTINYPLPFSTSAVITGNNTGLTISASTTGITITSPNSTTTYSGIVIVEGY